LDILPQLSEEPQNVVTLIYGSLLDGNMLTGHSYTADWRISQFRMHVKVKDCIHAPHGHGTTCVRKAMDAQKIRRSLYENQSRYLAEEYLLFGN